MTIEIKAPGFPESVADGLVTEWHKKPGDPVKRNEVLVDIETDKVVFEVPSPENGVMSEILEQEGATVVSGQLLARLEKSGTVSAASTGSAVQDNKHIAASSENSTGVELMMAPAAKKLVMEHQLDASAISGSGKGGRILKGDVLQYMDQENGEIVETAVAEKAVPEPKPEVKPAPKTEIVDVSGDRPQKRVPMTRLRARVAERLLEAQHNAAMLSTFNEINMQPVMELRSRYKDEIEKEHGVRLGFMSFFVKAAVEALKKFPEVNASIDGSDVVYHGFFDIGIAVGSPRGLLVPILWDADQMNMIAVEKKVAEYVEQAKTGSISIEDITGGTFTITNGGVFGSLLSTPILNPPQSAILGMHKIEERPVVVNGEIVIRPMMYLALSYDHRIIDGREAVQFLVTIKENLEDPAHMLLGM